MMVGFGRAQRRSRLGAARAIATAVILAAGLLLAVVGSLGFAAAAGGSATVATPASVQAAASPSTELAPQAVAYTPVELALVQLINNYRSSKGVPTLLVSDILSDSSTKHDLDMGKYHFFGHTTVASDYFKPGASPGDRMIACGYSTSALWGENIAAGFSTAESVFNAWMNSPSHNQNMLSPTWKVVGIGVDTVIGSDDGTYYTTDFGDYVDATAHLPGGSAPPDTTSPLVWFTAPVTGAEVSGRVTVTAQATDNLRVSRVELYADGVLLGTGDSSSYTCTWNTAGMNPGLRKLEARAYDSAGNVGVADIFAYVEPDPATTTTTTTVGAAPKFADVTPSNIYYTEITDLAADGVVSGCDDGLFHPADPVTRAQFAKIIVLALGLHNPDSDVLLHPTFVDVPRTGGDYPYAFVEEAAVHGIVFGYDDGTFAPTAKLTRAQLALMMVRAGGDKLSIPPSTYDARFTDVPTFAYNAVRTARYNNLLSGKTDTLFGPYDIATRGQVAKMVYGLIHVVAH